MADDITNGVLLEHMQGMKNGLQQQISDLKNDISGIKGDFSSLGHKVDGLAERMAQGFEEAKQHRQALQEDFDETMLASNNLVF